MLEHWPATLFLRMTMFRYLSAAAFTALLLATPAFGSAVADQHAQAFIWYVAAPTRIVVGGDIYCDVASVGGRPVVTCSNGRVTASGRFRQIGDTFKISDQYVEVDKPGSAKPLYRRLQPGRLGPVMPKGKAYGANPKKPFGIGASDEVAIKGSHLTLAELDNPGGAGAPSQAVEVGLSAYPSTAIIGSSYAALLDHGKIEIARFTASGKAIKMVYTHPVH